MASFAPTLKAKEEYKGTICACYHCGEHFGSASGVCSSLCKFCKTAEDREKMHKENREVTPNYVCAVCLHVEAMKAKAK